MCLILNNWYSVISCVELVVVHAYWPIHRRVLFRSKPVFCQCRVPCTRQPVWPIWSSMYTTVAYRHFYKITHQILVKHGNTTFVLLVFPVEKALVQTQLKAKTPRLTLCLPGPSEMQVLAHCHHLKDGPVHITNLNFHCFVLMYYNN